MTSLEFECTVVIVKYAVNLVVAFIFVKNKSKSVF